MSHRPDIAVFGAGAWGTALAMAWARQGAHVVLWGHPVSLVEELVQTRRHPRLADAELPPSILPVASPELAFTAPVWVSALPTQISPQIWKGLASQASDRPELLIHVSKGILQQGHQRLSEVLEPMLQVPVGVLSGPSFADEVALDRPTAIVLALPTSISEHRAVQLQALLSTPRLRLYLSRDRVGVELCGALKNTLAIAAGLVDSLGLGYNARAALVTRGLAEMSRLVERLGGRPETVMGLAGMGDLLLTATGPQSRNRRFGEMLGQGITPGAASASMAEQVVEGVFTTQAALALADEVGIELPIAREVARLIDGADPEEAVARLMNRSLKSE
ncbi:NAD(P)H-dependent glycerol-3-phosphate dehydrogenase [Holophaga foetida]|uniref:NAD(P)H-dependent glycerol-3-phosphate dehydrogenase n=1 Tax=Holophaga foetida TaxID=35839 RepID=UPI0002475068|nr:NAD(P)H-dependent glycerol-3-phosphate dehydrogenase [Holophaga foetida]